MTAPLTSSQYPCQPASHSQLTIAMADGTAEQYGEAVSERDEHVTKSVDESDDDEHESEEESEDEEDDDEPKLKYARMTGNLGAVYRNGDATSTFLVAGDKMVNILSLELG